ncbi:hypothetical protein C8J57DRAFT_1463258 [Mycena rebaudengoi]|nr:hypothetical protein C8J57DRAFT_1463258 [Mycena rebaudengoi]
MRACLFAPLLLPLRCTCELVAVVQIFPKSPACVITFRDRNPGRRSSTDERVRIERPYTPLRLSPSYPSVWTRLLRRLNIRRAPNTIQSSTRKRADAIGKMRKLRILTGTHLKFGIRTWASGGQHGRSAIFLFLDLGTAERRRRHQENQNEELHSNFIASHSGPGHGFPDDEAYSPERFSYLGYGGFLSWTASCVNGARQNAKTLKLSQERKVGIERPTVVYV